MHYASSFMMGINGVAITLSTLLSGRLSDLFGDKTPFLASLVVSILGMVILFWAKNEKPNKATKLPGLSAGKQVKKDLKTFGLTLRDHPLKLLRPILDKI